MSYSVDKLMLPRIRIISIAYMSINSKTLSNAVKNEYHSSKKTQRE